jgi:hypothetical protein
MRNLTLSLSLALSMTAATTLTAATNATPRAGEAVKIKLSETQVINGVLINGKPHVALSELSRAISGKDSLARGFRITGNTLSTDGSGGGAGGALGGILGGAGGNPCGGKCLLFLGGGGVISKNLVRVSRDAQSLGPIYTQDGSDLVFVPLADLAAAMGGSVQAGAVNRMYNVMGVGGAAGEAGACKKCLLIINPQGVMANPVALNPAATRRP